jgi:hypothetical protein
MVHEYTWRPTLKIFNTRTNAQTGCKDARREMRFSDENIWTICRSSGARKYARSLRHGHRFAFDYQVRKNGSFVHTRAHTQVRIYISTRVHVFVGPEQTPVDMLDRTVAIGPCAKRPKKTSVTTTGSCYVRSMRFPGRTRVARLLQVCCKRVMEKSSVHVYCPLLRALVKRERI